MADSRGKRARIVTTGGNGGVDAVTAKDSTWLSGLDTFLFSARENLAAAQDMRAQRKLNDAVSAVQGATAALHQAAVLAMKKLRAEAETHRADTGPEAPSVKLPPPGVMLAWMAGIGDGPAAYRNHLRRQALGLPASDDPDELAEREAYIADLLNTLRHSPDRDARHDARLTLNVLGIDEYGNKF